MEEGRKGPTNKSIPHNQLCLLCRGSNPTSCPLCRQKSNAVDLNKPLPPVGKEGEAELQEIRIESPSSTSISLAAGDPPPPSSKSKHEKKRMERKWRYFPGKNKFFCDGRLITAPNISFCFCCFLLIVVTFGLFIVFE